MRKLSLAFAGLVALSVPAFAGTVTAPASETLTVPPWNILTLTGSAANTACVATRLSDVPGQGQSQGSSAISGATPVELGPYSTETRFSLRCTAGGAAYSSAAANFIVTGGIVASDIDALDNPADEECPTYEATGPGIEWQPCGGSGGVEDGDKGDVVVDDDGATWTVDADSVALGTDTTGGYAASLTEGGAATTATALAADPADCAANEFANAIAASGALTCAALLDADVPNTITVDLAATATALAANGANCSAGSYPLGVDASGAVESCTAISAGIGGSLGATDNVILRSDGTGGATAQGSPLSIADTTGAISFPNGTGVQDRILLYNNAQVGAIKGDGNNFGIILTGSAGDDLWLADGALRMKAAETLGWTSTTTAVAGADTGFARNAAGVIKSTDGSTGIRGFQGGGAAVASAAAMPIPTGRVFHVTGTDNITSITSTNFQSGVVVTLIFDDVLTFTDGNNLKLNGNFVTSADDTITLAFDGSNWFEISRATN